MFDLSCFISIFYCVHLIAFILNSNPFDSIFADSLEAAYSLNWGAREIWGKGGGETLALL